MELDGIKLRAPEPEDLELLYKWENDTSLWHLGNTITPFSKHTLRQYLKSASHSVYEEGQLRFMIDLTKSNETIGTIDIFDFDPINLKAGVGILIADKPQRNKGYAGIALTLLMDYCKKKLNLNQVWCNILEDNKASINLFTAKGFKLCGLKQQWIRIDNSYKNELLFQCIL